MINVLKRRRSHSRNKNRNRQWGTEKDITPLSHLHAKPSVRTIAMSRVAIVLTIAFWLFYLLSVILRQLFQGPDTYQFTLEVFGYLVVVTFLSFSALMYLVARQGALQRFAKHVRVPKAIIDTFFSRSQPSITVLVPSYSEEPDVIRKTLLSAALQEYPKMRVVLLIDDNPNPTNEADIKRLEQSRQLPSEIANYLKKPSSRFIKALKRFEQTYKGKNHVKPASIKQLANHYVWAAQWLKDQAKQEPIEDHVDEFFADHVLKELANDLQLVGEALEHSLKDKATLSKDRVAQLYQRLVWIFGTEVASFERKKYVSLSSEPNKAMNLNSYISLMGGKYTIDTTPTGSVLLPVAKNKKADVVIPDSDFVLTLDADSILLKEYCLRLVHFLLQPDNADVAVTQTPYSSFRGASTRIERLSGATTDIQHILHQGMTYYGATFWVGANAVIRKQALEDIVSTEWVGGYPVNRYIQDNTVIEDTESSIDLALHGWRLVNYPERLSYSATPPDFGSLIVQRRRWANGGLLIMPKLWSIIRKRKQKLEHVSRIETMLRVNYMASIAWSNIGLIFLLAYPYDGRLLSPFVLLAATPYFLAMASDLRYCRYSVWDIIQIYGFNLILLPVNLAGVLKSIQQAITAKKIPFARTPKVKNRTAAGLLYVISPLLIIGFSVFTMWRNILGENWGNAAFAGFNAFASSWAVLAYIGIRNLLEDIWVGLTDYLYVDVVNTGKQTSKPRKPLLNWQAVLYHGEESDEEVPHQGFLDLVTKASNSKQ